MKKLLKRPSLQPIRDFRALYVALLLGLIFWASESFAVAISTETIDEKFCRGLEVKAQSLGLTPVVKKHKFSVENGNIKGIIDLAHQIPVANQKILNSIKTRAKDAKLSVKEIHNILSSQRSPEIYHCSTQLYSMVFGHGLYSIFQSGTEEQKEEYKAILLNLMDRSTETTASTLHLMYYISSLRNLLAYQFIPEEFDRKIYNLRQGARIIIEEHTYRNYSAKKFKPSLEDYNNYIFEDFALSDPLRQDLRRLVHVLMGVAPGPKLTYRESMFASHIAEKFSSFANLMSLGGSQRRLPSHAF